MVNRPAYVRWSGHHVYLFAFIAVRCAGVVIAVAIDARRRRCGRCDLALRIWNRGRRGRRQAADLHRGNPYEIWRDFPNEAPEVTGRGTNRAHERVTRSWIAMPRAGFLATSQRLVYPAGIVEVCLRHQERIAEPTRGAAQRSRIRETRIARDRASVSRHTRSSSDRRRAPRRERILRTASYSSRPAATPSDAVGPLGQWGSACRGCAA